MGFMDNNRAKNLPSVTSGPDSINLDKHLYKEEVRLEMLPALRPIFPQSITVTKTKKGKLKLTLNDGKGGKKVINVSNIIRLLEDFSL